jgi:CHAT domain-containing protein
MAALDLSGTELIVLSACETGLGRSAGGEGLLGLQRASQVAGAGTVVACLWKVDDLQAMALMSRFYENLWGKGMSKLEALREAQLTLLHGEVARGPGIERRRPDDRGYRVSPRVWAAWVLSGDFR